MGFPIISIPEGSSSRLLSCDEAYAPLPWNLASVEVIGTGGGMLPRGIVTLTNSVTIGATNQAYVNVPRDFPRPSALKCNLAAGDIALSFRVELPDSDT